jgi:hypothetical protein
VLQLKIQKDENTNMAKMNEIIETLTTKPTCIKKLNAFLSIAKISSVVKIRTY